MPALRVSRVQLRASRSIPSPSPNTLIPWRTPLPNTHAHQLHADNADIAGSIHAESGGPAALRLAGLVLGAAIRRAEYHDRKITVGVACAGGGIDAVAGIRALARAVRSVSVAHVVEVIPARFHVAMRNLYALDKNVRNVHVTRGIQTRGPLWLSKATKPIKREEGLKTLRYRNIRDVNCIEVGQLLRECDVLFFR